MTAEIALWALAIALVLIGLAGTIVPVLPGVPLVFAGLFLAAWAGDFQRVTWPTLLILGLLAVFSFVIDIAATALGTSRVGATRLAIIGALAGTLVGIFFGIPGLILGPFLGAVVGELVSHGRVKQASRVGIATWKGLIVGTLAKLGLAFAMLGVFVVGYLY